MRDLGLIAHFYPFQYSYVGYLHSQCEWNSISSHLSYLRHRTGCMALGTHIGCLSNLK